MTNREIITLNNQFRESEDGGGDSLDLAKLLFLLKKSIPVIILLFIAGITTSYIIVRYTKPLYQSESVIKLDFESKANSLGLVQNSQIQNNLNDISGEIELLKSRLFLSRVVSEINYPVSYHFYGTYLTDEKYNSSPIEVSFKIKNPGFYDRSIDILLTNEKDFELSFEYGDKMFSKTYQFGEEISTEDFNFLIEKTPNFQKEMFGKYFFKINSQEALIRYFESNMVVQPENFNAKTIKISLSDFNPHKAREFLSVVSRLYLNYSTEVKNQVTEQKLIFLDTLTQITEAKIQEYESYFENFTIQNKTTSLQADLSRTIVLLNALDSQQFNLRNQYTAVRSIQKGLSENEGFTINPFLANRLPAFIIDDLKKYQQMVDEREKRLISYNENTSVVRRIDAQLAEDRTHVLALVSQYLSNLDVQMREVRTRREMIENNFVELPSMGTEYNKNRRLYQEQEELLASLRQSKMDLEITRAGTVSDFIILAPANTPTVPIKPQKTLIYGVGVTLAFLLSLLFVLSRYLLHNSITSVRELERLTNVPIIGSIPRFLREKLSRTRLVIDFNSKSAISESLRSIRTNMEFIRSSNDTNLITITSTISGEGKTFVAVNLGAIIASSQQKVCIVDLDMRKPKVHLAFGHELTPQGVSTYLIGKSTIESCIQSSGVENLSYIAAGPTPPNPSELIMSSEFDRMLEVLKEKFDLVIMDTPPVGLVTDGVLAMKKSDLQLYVLRSEYSKRNFIQTIRNLQRINHFSNMVLLLNDVKAAAGGYGYGYGYGYYEEKKDRSVKSFFSSLF